MLNPARVGRDSRFGSRIGLLSPARAHPLDDLLRGGPLWVVLGSKDSRRLCDHLLEPVSSESRLERLGDVPAPAPWTREMIDLVDEVLRQQQIRAYVHAPNDGAYLCARQRA